MKKPLSIAAAILLPLAALTSCTKESNRTFNTNFYATEANAGLSLYIDGVYQGQLAYFQSTPDCAVNNSDGPKAVNLQLNSGVYNITAKDASGKVVSDSKLTLSASTLASTGNAGSQVVTDNGTCLAVGLAD